MASAPLYFPFDRERTVEAVAYLLSYLGGRVSKLFVIKLLYLADRESLARHGAPICGGPYFSLPQGPIVGQALDVINERHIRRIGWSLESDGREVVLKDPIGIRSLSKDDTAILDAVIEQFGKLSMGQLLAHVHSLPEYTKPVGNRNSVPIRTSAMLKGRGLSAEQIDAIEAEIRERDAFHKLLSKAATK